MTTKKNSALIAMVARAVARSLPPSERSREERLAALIAEQAADDQSSRCWQSDTGKLVGTPLRVRAHVQFRGEYC
jgi:hypothetical protein